MDVIGKGKLTAFCEKHADVCKSLGSWLAEAEETLWQTPQDIKKRYASASFMANNRVVFNIKGNDYRLDTKVDYQRQIVVIVRVGTHQDYSKWKF